MARIPAPYEGNRSPLGYCFLNSFCGSYCRKQPISLRFRLAAIASQKIWDFLLVLKGFRLFERVAAKTNKRV